MFSERNESASDGESVRPTRRDSRSSRARTGISPAAVWPSAEGWICSSSVHGAAPESVANGSSPASPAISTEESSPSKT